ncbi:unnamed protein product [Brachionus calyciflorus]|uniref:Trafficking protein particle complex subunit 11 domain-containing protein n=1 Tax=Brachionus calyciflorus TaxID=104777 RepID=A0A813MNA2_9BILA|nr:unnamed protein product [Brachionus calyciflorus]
MSWASHIPTELSVHPLPLVVLTGLDIRHNAVHKEIWDGFYSKNNTKFRYSLLDGDHEYPKAKGKRSLEVYVEKGILKTNWFHKHLYLIPSLVVVFFELDWDEPNWKEKQMECATKIELVRQSLLDRNTRIILILIQKHPNIPVDGDSGLTKERYPSLCNACSIKTNHLFLLHVEYLQGYIMKLEEEAFNEPTQTYYNLEIKAVKFKRDSLIKVTHQYLFVRLPIKIAFFNEMKQDIFKAIDNYKQAYLSLLDIRFGDTNTLEIKTVAGIINYKLCKLLFEIKHPIDAIEQFRRHIDIFKLKIGPSDLAFEHSAWMSKQFQVMGELFENAINKEYFNAVQTQHPGFYFHSSANYSIQRRIHSREILQSLNLSNKNWTSENPSPIESIDKLEFLGQRPWRQAQKSMEILDQLKEKDGILCLQELESKENLSPLITNLFKQAISHFKIFNCKRMKQYLSVCMAEEYFYAKDYQESLNIYVQVLNDYSNEHWWPILTSIMFNALKCAYLVADITNYCLICTEIIGKNTILSNETKSLIQKNLIRVISNEVPIVEYHQIDTSIHSIENVSQKWKEEMAKQSSPTMGQNMETSQVLSAHKLIPAHVNGMVPFVDCKVRFTSTIFNSNEYVELKVYLRTNCVDQIQFDKLYVRFNIPAYNQYCILQNKDSLNFEPNKIYELDFKFLPQSSDIGKDLEISSLSLEIGNRENRVLILHWKGDCKNALAEENFTLDTFKKLSLPYRKSDAPRELDWNEINISPSTSIVSRKSKIELVLEHKQPVIVNECYPIKLTIVNKEETTIENLSLSVELLSINSASDIDSPISTIDKNIARLWIGSIDKNLHEIGKTYTLPNLESKQQLTEIIYIQMRELKSFELSFKLNYTNETELGKNEDQERHEFDTEIKSKKIVKCSCVQENKIKLETINPFQFNFKFLSMQMGEIEVVRFGEPFFVLCEISNNSAYALKFKDSYLEKGKLVNFKESEENESFLKYETLKSIEMATECFCLVINDDSDSKKVPLGELVLKWKRRNLGSIFDTKEIDEDIETDSESNDDLKQDDLTDELIVETRFPLPEVLAEPFPFIIESELPDYGWLGKEFNLNYKIINKTQSVLEIECSLSENEFFAISGKKMDLIQILPNDFYNFTYLIYPLKIGHCKLPSFHVKVNSPIEISDALKKQESQANSSDSLDTVIENMIPSQLYIFPEKIDSIFKE